MAEHELTIRKRKYNIAGLKILMTTYHRGTMERAEKYIATEDWDETEADGVIDFGQEYYEEIYQERPYNTYNSIEYMCTGALFHRILLNYNGCMLHSSAVVVDGYAYLFSADSGTGKSTHTQLWMEYFGNRAFIINDDKPVIRMMDGEWYVFGTPWSGKTDKNCNVKVKLGAIVFLERAQENYIREITPAEAIPEFLKQTVRKLNKEENMDKVLNQMEKILMTSPIYRMGCNISEDAVKMAYEKIRRV